MNKKKLCIYHGNCADGFGAAWVVRKAFGEENVEFHPGIYGQPPPDCTDREVIMVDFSYKRLTLLDMAAEAKNIFILDHHKSAEKDLIELPLNVTAVFDMERSGAMLAWNQYFPERTAPELIRHIQDRDLWKFELDGTREIQASVFSYPYDFNVWDVLMSADKTLLQRDGRAIVRKQEKDVNELLGVGLYRTTIGGHEVPVLNAPYFFSSEAGQIMCKGEPFAACYWDTPNNRVYSLRSNEDGLDVSEIAFKFGGGGHKHAAGFTISYDKLLDLVKENP